MAVGIKYMVIGESAAGKSTTLKSLEDCFVFYADTKKRFPLKMLHTNIYSYKEFVSKVDGKVVNALPDKAIEYQGMAKFKQAMIDKLLVYHAAKGVLPKTIAFDSVTNIYKMIADYVKTTTTNVYGSHSTDIARDADDFLSWIEREIIGRGINVVFLAHSVVHQETGEPRVATSGSKSFEATGSFLGVFNYASYIYIKDGVRTIAHKDMMYPHVCRSMLTDIDDEEDAEMFNAQEMLGKIQEFENDSTDFTL